MIDRKLLLALLACLSLTACGGGTGGTGGDGVTGAQFGGPIDLASFDVTGTARAKPTVTMGALEAF